MKINNIVECYKFKDGKYCLLFCIERIRFSNMYIVFSYTVNEKMSLICYENMKLPETLNNL